MLIKEIPLRSISGFGWLAAMLTVAGCGWAPEFPSRNPSGRHGAAMAYDAAHKNVVLFGGNPAPADTWLWDGGNWTQQTPAMSPHQRQDHSMAYDAAHQKVVLFGGDLGSGMLFGDTWLWDGANWTQQSPFSSPTARGNAAMAYDDLHRQVVLFGGFNNLGDTWVWDGTRWTQISLAAHPSARWGHAMAYDEVHQQTVLFGGSSGGNNSCANNVCGDTWTWNGATWIQKFPATSPSPRYGHAMAYDPFMAATILFGGLDSKGNLLGDTWLWNGTNWKVANQFLLGPPPIAREFARWRPVPNRLVLCCSADMRGILAIRAIAGLGDFSQPASSAVQPVCFDPGLSLRLGNLMAFSRPLPSPSTQPAKAAVFEARDVFLGRTEGNRFLTQSRKRRPPSALADASGCSKVRPSTRCDQYVAHLAQLDDG